jgi:hypothetical protein
MCLHGLTSAGNLSHAAAGSETRAERKNGSFRVIIAAGNPHGKENVRALRLLADVLTQDN